MTEILAAQDTSIGPAGGRKNADVTAWVAVAAGALGADAFATGVFVVAIYDSGSTTEHSTSLNKKWMQKPLMLAIIEPVLKHRYKKEFGKVRRRDSHARASRVVAPHRPVRSRTRRA